jgi:hypothetical protein
MKGGVEAGIPAMAARLHFLADRESKPLAGLGAVERLLFLQAGNLSPATLAGPGLPEGPSPGSPVPVAGNGGRVPGSVV